MNIGLVLSGGMAKGAYQIGALQALSQFVPASEIKYISSASIGVLNAYAFAVNRLNDAEKMWKSICQNDTRLIVSQILRSSLLQQNIEKIYDPEMTLSSSFYCTLFDFNSRKIVYQDLSKIDNPQISQYLKACVALPIYNRAIRLDNAAYFDGAMIDNIPVYPLLKHNIDYIICIYFDDVCYKFENTYFDNKVIKITFPCKGLLKQSLVLRQEGIEDMIRSGYDRTMCLLKTIFSDGHEDIESIYRAIERTNQNSHGSLRITGDLLITNLNKITQRLTKRKILY